MARRRRSDLGGGFNERDIEAAAGAFMRLPARARLLVVLLILAAASAAAFVYYKQHHPTPTTSAPAPAVDSPHLLLGNPSGAKADVSDRNNYLMIKPFFALSYDDDEGTPNWVSWRVTEADLGTAPRKRTFDADEMLPPGFTRITHGDYSGSGFDRGHLCPHSDRAANEQMSYATFVMTNIIPQAPNVNQKAWANLEIYCRDLIRKRHDRLYVIAGAAGRGGTGSAGFKERIGKGSVAVPAECWKIIVDVPGDGGEDDLQKINAGTRVIAVVMPNDNDAVSEAWAGFRTTPADVERKTGYHFFDRLPAEVATALREKVDGERIPTPAKIVHGE